MQETLKRTPEKKVTSQVYFLTVTAVLTALTYIFTAFINVRLPIAANGGLVHLGNVPLFLAAMICGRKTGMIAGGIGMGLFDLMSGWTMWAPFTLVIVGVMGYVMGAMTERHRTFRWRALAILVVTWPKYFCTAIGRHHFPRFPGTSCRLRWRLCWFFQL